MLEILYESVNFIFVNKPYDMYINSDDQHEMNTVACALGQADGHRRTSRRPLRFVQRLDYATSGALCLALSRAAAASAGRLLETRLARKYYLAVLRGHVASHACDVHYPIGDDESTSSTSHKMVAVTGTGPERAVRPRAAQTRLLLLERGQYAGEPASVALLKPTTGRRHQLRVHCAALGHPVLGDYTYSCGRDADPHRMFLHARRTVLPVEGEPLDVATAEPFHSDVRFNAQWTSHTLLHAYQTNADFRACCQLADNIDESQVELFKN